MLYELDKFSKIYTLKNGKAKKLYTQSQFNLAQPKSHQVGIHKSGRGWLLGFGLPTYN